MGRAREKHNLEQGYAWTTINQINQMLNSHHTEFCPELVLYSCISWLPVSWLLQHLVLGTTEFRRQSLVENERLDGMEST